ncbi:MAG: hypothetical protein RQ761_10475 [Bacteroidales bacterium]|nr:hypothetical protein [Bacteroidales bacterium]
MRREPEAPRFSANTFTDIYHYLIHKPSVKTLIKHSNSEARAEISKSILQRTGVNVENYKMLNLHRIGIEAPASYVFDELLKWSGESNCWPNNLARVNLQNDQLDQIKIHLFGIHKKIAGWNLFHLFDLSVIRIQSVPAPSDFDNARYLLYECKGGYPIGIFSMYVRSSIPEGKEKEMSQLFSLVSFNFYGRKKTGFKLMNRVWEAIHNRVTANVVWRFKQLCEYKFNDFKSK